jgi:uncharacterized membrane protein YgaE (UPF0421/DUF939 family)
MRNGLGNDDMAIYRLGVSRPESALQRAWISARRTLVWTPPTRTEFAVVLKAGLAAGVSFSLARIITNVPNPLLAPATAIVTVHATALTSLRTAFQRSVAVAVGVLVALAVGTAVPINGLTVALLTIVSLGLSVLVFRFAGGAANQLPITVLLVLAVVSYGQRNYGLGRAVDTIIGAAVGGAVSVVFPASRLREAHDALARLAAEVAACLGSMGAGVQQPWTEDATSAWEDQAQRARTRLARRAVDAIGSGRHAARWNYRDRRQLGNLSQYEDMAPRLERISVGVSEIARDLDRTATRAPDAHPPMPKLGELLLALADAVRALGHQLDAPQDERTLRAALEDVRLRRDDAHRGATRRAQLAVDAERANAPDPTADEWLEYGAVLVHADAIVADLLPPPD